MPTRTVHPGRQRKRAAQEARAAGPTTAPPAQRLGRQVVGVSLLLALPLAAQVAVLSGAMPMLGLLGVVSGLFLAAVLGSGAQLWRNTVPSGRLASALAGSSVLWGAALGGLLISTAGLVPQWQTSYTSSYATSTLPLLVGVPLLVVIGGWASQAIDGASRIRRALAAYSGIAAAVSLALALALLHWQHPVSPWAPLALLLGGGVHLLVLWWAWRLRATAEQVRDQELSSRW